MATILLVEDTPANQALATKLLEAAGHRVLSADTAGPGSPSPGSGSPTWCCLTSGCPT